MRYLGLFVQNSFVQLSKISEETPAFAEYVAYTIRKYKNVLRKQLYLQNHGVSFDYTDKQSYMQVDELIKVCQDMDEEIENMKG